MKIIDFLLRYLACLSGFILGEWIISGEDVLDVLSGFNPYIMALLLSIVLSILNYQENKKKD